jgi:hypothetical protein
MSFRIAWAMTGLHGDPEVQVPWRRGDIRPIIRSPDGREGRNRFKTALVPLIRRNRSVERRNSMSEDVNQGDASRTTPVSGPPDPVELTALKERALAAAA